MEKRLTLRPARPDEHEFLYVVTKRAMQEHAERVYGPWDDADQRRNHARRALAEHEIVELDGTPIGLQHIAREADRIVLNRIFLLPEHQGRGHGTQLLRALQAEARDAGLPITLRVLRGNPARRLYQRLGFVLDKEGDNHTYMRWTP